MIRDNHFGINIYEDIQELPMINYNVFNEYCIISEGVGSGKEDLKSHIEKIILFFANDYKDKALQEWMNTYQCIWYTLRGVDFKELQYICLSDEKKLTENSIYNFFGIELNELTKKANDIMLDISLLMKEPSSHINGDDIGKLILSLNTFLLRVMEILKENAAPYRQFHPDILNEVKNSIKKQLQVSYPVRFSDASQLNYYSQLRDKVICELQYVIDGDNRHLEKSKQIESHFIGLINPFNFDGNSPDNIVYQQKQLFEKLCVMMITKGFSNPEKMSVYRFYAALNMLESNTQK